jgi:hypothetical protein
MQLLPEASYELGTSIKNDSLRHSMQTHDARNIQLSVLFSPVASVHWDEMSGLGKSVDDSQMELNLWSVRGKPTMKSILMSSHF